MIECLSVEYFACSARSTNISGGICGLIIWQFENAMVQLSLDLGQRNDKERSSFDRALLFCVVQVL